MRVVLDIFRKREWRARSDCTRFAVSASLLAPIMNPIIGDFFIHNVANKTLHCLKAYVKVKGRQSASHDRLRHGTREDAPSSPVSDQSRVSAPAWTGFRTGPSQKKAASAV